MYALLVTYTSAVPTVLLRDAQIAFAEQLVSTPGFVSKTWLHEGTTHGGFYLFDSREAAEAYVNGQLFASLGAAPVISDVTVRGYDVQSDLGVLTAAGRPVAA
jgi:hypothetical protein